MTPGAQALQNNHIGPLPPLFDPHSIRRVPQTSNLNPGLHFAEGFSQSQSPGLDVLSALVGMRDE
jgi:hypothetical protein